jgi:hypothetical protein
MAVKPKNVEEDSWAYTLPHEVGFLIQELAENEARELSLSKLSTSSYLERTIKRLAEEKLTPEALERARERAEKRTEERRQRATERERVRAAQAS